jgi:DNA (cytosine-5)-methyltransferase 1
MSNQGIPTIDLFAGAGGLGIGAARAGADVRLSVDSDRLSCETLRANANASRDEVLEADVSTLTGDELRSRAGLSRSDPLLIVGGPPCQPFSKAAYWIDEGKEARYRRDRAAGLKVVRPEPPVEARPDSRRTLVEDYWRLIVEADADAFLFENVRSITHPRNRPVLEALQASAHAEGYDTTLAIVNAVDYGVPQRRQRVFLMGSRGAAPFIPPRTHADPGRGEGLLPWATVGPAIEEFQGRRYAEPEEKVEGRWAEHLRTVPPGGNYKAHTAWGGHPEPTFVTETRFWNFLLKLSPDLPSWTINASPGPWTGPFHWDSRRLRTAELAALQTFPAGYRFVGSKRERVRQIGNAVPVDLGSIFVGATLSSLDGAGVGRKLEKIAA